MSEAQVEGAVVAEPLATPTPTPKSKRNWIDPSLGLAVGLLVYFLIGFHHTLPPGRVGWLLNPTHDANYWDPGTTYMGWDYFRRSPWTFPLGANPNYGLEFASGIVFSDSLPLFAIFFKIFDPVLGKDFQYTGIWIFCCFALQGMFGSMLAGRFARGVVPKLLTAAFFSISPIMLERAWNQYALMGHWIILWAFYLFFTDRPRPLRWVWMVVASIAATTSFYFLPMVLAIALADLIKTLISRRWTILGYLLLLIELPLVIGSAIFVMWVTGYFLIPVENSKTVNFGTLATNLLGPFDSWSRATFMAPQHKSPLWRGEGYIYLGFGLMLLCAVAIKEFFRSPPNRWRLLRLSPLLLVLAAMAVFSLSDNIYFGQFEVLNLQGFFARHGSAFRASARFAWPMYYAVMLAACVLTVRGLKVWKASIVLGVLFGFQLFDIYPVLRHLNENYTQVKPWRSPLRNKFWTEATKRYRYFVIVPSGRPVHYVPLAYLAAKHGIATNGCYLNRFPDTDKIGRTSDERVRSIERNELLKDTLYIVPEQGRFDVAKTQIGRQHGIGVIDGYQVIAPFWHADDRAPTVPELKPGGKP